MATILKGKTFINRFDPSLVSGLQLWLDASDSTTLFQDSAATTPAVADGDPIGCWKDKSGKGYNLLQSNGINKPMLKTSVQKGRNAVQADGVNDLLTTSSSSILSTQPYQYYLTMKWLKTNSFMRLIYGGNDFGNLDCAGANNWNVYAGSLLNGGTATTNPVQATVTYNGAYSSLKVNGTLQLSGLAGYGAPTTISLFNHGSYANGAANAELYELLVFSNTLSSQNSTSVENYLANKWGI